MQAIRDSYIYHICCMVMTWLSRKWDESLIVGWMTGSKLTKEGSELFERLHAGEAALFEKLRLSRLLEGSLFLHPAFFAAITMALSPLLPTLAELALVLASAFSLVLYLGVHPEYRIGYSPIRKYVVLYALVYLYATLTSTSVSGSLFSGLLTIVFVLFFVVLTSCRFTDRQLRGFVIALVAVGVVVSFYGFYQMAFPYKFRSVWTDEDMFSSISFRVYSTLENPNVLGEYFLLLIPLGFALLLTAEGWRAKAVNLIACGIMCFCLVVTYSRGCYLGLMFAAAVFLVLLDRRLIVVGVAAILLSPLYLPESVLMRFASIGNMGDTSTSYRVFIWMGTLAMLKDYWFCGIGPGGDAFNTVYPRYAYNAITAPHSHNLFLQITCDSGICGLLVFLLIIIAYYRMMFTAIRRETDKKAKIFEIAAVASVSGFLVESMTDYTFYNYRVVLLFWAMLGLSVLFTRMGKTAEGNEEETA